MKCIEHPALFKWLANRVSYPANMKAGKYEIRKGTNLLNILKMLKNGRQVPVNLVITKLRTREDLGALIGRKFECDSLLFMRYINNPDTLKFYGLDTNTFHDHGFPEHIYLFLEHNTFPDFQKNGTCRTGLLDA